MTASVSYGKRGSIIPDGVSVSSSSFISPESKEDSKLGSREVQLVDPTLAPSTHPDYNLGALPLDLFGRICLWLDPTSFSNFSLVNKSICLALLGGRKLKDIFTRSGLVPFLEVKHRRDVPAVFTIPGFNLLRILNAVCAFPIKNLQDLFNQAKQIPEWAMAPEESKELLEKTFIAVQKVLPKKLANLETLQGANLSRLFNLITNGEIDVSFTRPPSGLTEIQKQKIEQNQKGYHLLNRLVISAIKQYIQIVPQLPRFNYSNPAEGKVALTAFFDELKRARNDYLPNTEIERILLKNLPLIFDVLPPIFNKQEKDRANVEYCTYIITELLRFGLAELTDEERIQLETTLEETFDIVKHLYPLTFKTCLEQKRKIENAEWEVPVLQPALPLGQPIGQPWPGVFVYQHYRTLEFWQQATLGIGAFAFSNIVTPILLDQLPVALPSPIPFLSKVATTYSLFLGLTRLTTLSSRRTLETVAPALSLTLASFVASLTPYLPSHVPYLPTGTCLQLNFTDSIRSLTGDMRLLDNDPLVLITFLLWVGLTIGALEE